MIKMYPHCDGIAANCIELCALMMRQEIQCNSIKGSCIQDVSTKVTDLLGTRVRLLGSFNEPFVNINAKNMHWAV